MKKWGITGCAALAAAVLAAVSIYRWKKKTAIAVSVIGGADGPTSVFLAGRIPSVLHLGMAAASGIVLLVLLLLLIWQHNKKK